MAKLEVTLLGKRYPLACSDGDEARVEALAGYVDGKLRALAGSQSSATESRLFLLTCIMLADEVFELKADLAEWQKKAAGDMQGSEAMMVAAVEDLTGRLEKLAQRLAAA